MISFIWLFEWIVTNAIIKLLNLFFWIILLNFILLSLLDCQAVEQITDYYFKIPMYIP